MKLSISFSWLLLVLATSSVVAKKAKKTKTTKNKNMINSVGPSFVPIDNDNDNDSDNNPVPIPVGAANKNCDPRNRVDGCKDGDCASDFWDDGCQGCKCYNRGNASWCDGSKNDYYDQYFEDNGENPFGDDNPKNRKCNTKFSQQDVSCQGNWECESGLFGCYFSKVKDTNICCRNIDRDNIGDIFCSHS